MSNLFKKWSPKKSAKSTTTPEKTNDENKSPPLSKTNISPGEDFEEGEGFDLPDSFSSRRPNRNLSISRSGRHKMRRNVRTSVMSQELYSQDGATNRAPNQPWTRESQTTISNVQTGVPSSGANSYPYCRETMDSTTNNLSGSQRMTRAPTAV